MIGVIAEPGEHPIVEEFFELFKTPWEFYETGRAYDVVIVTSAEAPLTDARLRIVYGSDVKSDDHRYRFAALSRLHGGTVMATGYSLPIYGDLLTFAPGEGCVPVAEASARCAGLIDRLGDTTIVRLGYDLFREIRFLLSEGQPVEHAQTPTLDVHIAMLRQWILDAAVPLVEIAPAPAGHRFIACLTHDIDFVGIRNHVLDHTMWGFLYRSTFGACRNWLRGRIPLTRAVRMWAAAMRLPFVYLKWARDFWDPFDWYVGVEKKLAATYFLIPLKGRAGERVPGPAASRRAAAYDVSGLAERIGTLVREGCEIGVHGIDAWHDVERAQIERSKIVAVTDAAVSGIRTHWLLRDANTASVLDEAGYTYDAGLGYNETVGYRNGTGQVFRPLNARNLLALPLHIQDGALFFPERLDLSEPQAEARCRTLADHFGQSGGVLTILWHDRSHGPERFWGDFYLRLLQMVRSQDCWFATASQAVGWFRSRRAIRFRRIDGGETTRIALEYREAPIQPAARIRIHGRGRGADTPLDLTWDGTKDVDLAPFAPPVSELVAH